jgi:N6-adenosine-specific RNA methylase IME4
MAEWTGLHPPYGTIVVDPPWRYREAKGIVTRGHRGGSAEEHYSTMSNSEIAALPVGALAAPRAHCYLWVTVPRLFGDQHHREIPPFEILTSWGFEFKTMLTWVKTGALGLGFYFRGQTEHVLFGVRGDLPIPPAQRIPNVFTAAKGRHSEKPPSFLAKVETVSPAPYLELFARQPALGWDSWGWGEQTAAEDPPGSRDREEPTHGR